MKRAAARICMMLAIAMLVSVPGSSQVPSRIEVGRWSGSSFTLDHSGPAATEIEFIFRAGLVGIEPIRSAITTAVDVGPNSVSVIDVLGPGPVWIVPDGKYDASVRIRIGIHGNWSDESQMIQVKISSKKPPTPTNFGVSG